VAALPETARQSGHGVDVSGSRETECADSCQALLQVLDWILSDGAGGQGTGKNLWIEVRGLPLSIVIW
jgi:hypothetical protein